MIAARGSARPRVASARSALSRFVSLHVAPASVVALLGCSPSPRDVVPESRDVRVTPDAGDDAYVHVARRAHGVVALAEARRMADDDARAIVERIADELERCATGLEAQGLLVEGAARVVAVAGPNGTPALSVRLAPGDAVAHNALVCLVAPVRATTLPPPTSDGAPGLAIEATWGPARASISAPDPGAGVDAGGPL
ncbi:MAG: hypothetical protein KIS78_31130 [Labilithrix sp.]|nr:hypothetical protein [Labilithrix sp.]MCW5836888.1 hypothetical protein [Labilithrix sp.]